MGCFIQVTKERLVTVVVFDKQSQWEILEYEIRKFSIRYSKVIAKEKRKILQKSLSCDKNIKSIINLRLI